MKLPNVTLTSRTYEDIKKILCPYCLHEIPETFEGGDFIHKLSENVWVCKAMPFRKNVSCGGGRA
jgi:hypothetical protein